MTRLPHPPLASCDYCLRYCALTAEGRAGVQRIVVYPAYVNRKLSIADGRKIPASKGEATHLRLRSGIVVGTAQQSALRAACEDPNVLEIADCCNIGLKIPAEPEVGRLTPKRPWSS